VALLALGVAVYDVEIDAAKLPAALVTFVVGVVSFAALGLALASLIRTASAASSTANATVLPLALISGVFFSVADAPRWIQVIGDVFPLKPFVSAMQDAFDPAVEAPGLSPGRLAVVAAWGLVGVVVALTRFRWEPSGAPARRTRRRVS
jgi:ABC-2 type transport system permease protein